MWVPQLVLGVMSLPPAGQTVPITPCCPPLAGPHLSRKHWPSTWRLLSSEVLPPHVWVSLRLLAPAFLRGRIPQGRRGQVREMVPRELG